MKKELQAGAAADKRTAADSIPSASLVQNGMLPAVDMKYRPTASQWQKIIFETEMAPTCSYSNVELINFKTSKVHLKGGLRMPFDCLSEAQYIHVVNGGFYEDAPQIDEKCRV